MATDDVWATTKKKNLNGTCSKQFNSFAIIFNVSIRFSGGPNSQTETIELRGFEESDKAGKRKQSAAHKKRAKEWAVAKQLVFQQNILPKEEEHPKMQSFRTASPISAPENSSKTDKGAAGDQDNKVKDSKEIPEQSLDLEDILKSDTFSGFMTVRFC